MKSELQCAHWSILRSCQLLGVPVTPAIVKALLPYDKNGHSMLQVLEALKTLGLNAEAKKESLQTLGNDGYPCIVHLHTPDHFVVVCDADEHTMHIYDGAGHRAARSRESVRARFGGEVLYVRRCPEDMTANASVESASGPRIRFETLLVDKGFISASGEPVAFVYPFHNSGNADLAIARIHPDCKCVKAEGPQKSVQPGCDGEIRLFYYLNFRRFQAGQAARFR